MVTRDTAAYALGLDIGGTKLAAGVVGADGMIYSFLTHPTRAGDSAETTLRAMFALGGRALAEAGADAADVPVIGIGCGGPLDVTDGVVHDPPNLPTWHEVPVVRMTTAAFERPAFLGNDAVVAALGEYHYGAGAGGRDMVYLTVSTGVGGAAIVDGRLLEGRHGNGGEFGHTIVVADGRRCSCGARGCLEAYASGTSIAARAQERLAAGASSILTAQATLTGRDVAQAARAGDELALDVWNDTTRVLGTGIATFVNLFEPELVVLGGGVVRTGEQLLAPVRRRVLSLALPAFRTGLRVVSAELGDAVGVVGAAALAFERTGGRPPVVRSASTADT